MIAAQLRAQADELARELRELDVRIQHTNWEVDLLDEQERGVQQDIHTNT